jgi:hypothetical protein
LTAEDIEFIELSCMGSRPQSVVIVHRTIEPASQRASFERGRIEIALA